MWKLTGFPEWIRRDSERHCRHGHTDVYDLLLKIFGSIADEPHAALLEDWLLNTWIPFVSQ